MQISRPSKSSMSSHVNVSNLPDPSIIARNLIYSDFRDLLHEEGSDIDDRVPSSYDFTTFNCSYWDSTTLAQHNSNNRTIFLLHFNIQCLPAKFDNLLTFLNLLSSNSYENLPSILALSETWLDEFNEKAFPISGFHPLLSRSRKDNSSRGGVGLYIHDDITFTPRPDLDIFIPFIFESTFVTLNDLNITIEVIYRSPAANTAASLQACQQHFYNLHQCKDKVFLLGDFNFDLLDYHSDTNVSEFVDLCFEFGFTPTITKPTRITSTCASCLDNIITNAPPNPLSSGVLIEDISDHFPVFCQIPSRTA